MKLTPEMIEGFSKSLLQKNFDNLKPTPAFHRVLWKYFCLDHDKVAIAAPRGHAKSTALTHTCTLAAALFRWKKHILIVSDTEQQAIQFLSNIKNELNDNEELRALFKFKRFLKENEREIIVEIGDDKHQFRILVRGSLGSVRGFLWRHSRPDLIIGDDLENDEIVMNPERREKFMKWMFGALFPAMSDTGHVRIVGTILHFDSFLARLMPDEKDKRTRRKDLFTYSRNREAVWKSVCFRAHTDFDDFSSILWPDRFPESRLKAIKQGYVDQGYPEGYSQEYLNYPIAEASAYFRREDFIQMDEEDRTAHGNFYAAIDFAISTQTKANRTAIVVGKVDERKMLHIVDARAGRWDAKKIIEEMMSIQRRYKPELFVAEKGVIEKAIGPFLQDEMFKQGAFINLHLETPINDKRSRARSIQGRMRAGGVKFDKESSWYADLEQEMLRFDRDDKDDYVDSIAWLGLIINKMFAGATQQELQDDAYEEEVLKDPEAFWQLGRDATTGY